MTARLAILVVSDTRDASTDESGPALREALRGVPGLVASTFEVRYVADDRWQIETALKELSETADAIFTAGGTGFSARDVTPEATSAVLDRRADGLAELLRAAGARHTPLSRLSRGVAGVRGSALIVNLPGAPKAVVEGAEALAPLLPNLLRQLAGEECTHECS